MPLSMFSIALATISSSELGTGVVFTLGGITTTSSSSISRTILALFFSFFFLSFFSFDSLGCFGAVGVYLNFSKFALLRFRIALRTSADDAITNSITQLGGFQLKIFLFEFS